MHVIFLMQVGFEFVLFVLNFAGATIVCVAHSTQGGGARNSSIAPRIRAIE